MRTQFWPWRRGAPVLIAGLAMALSIVAVVPVGASPAAPSQVQPTVVWAECGDGFECATLTVPLDYANPAGGDIDLSLIRKPAADPAARIGSLLTNPGGPGGSGVDFVRSTAVPDGLLANLNSQFDIVGWDPRGTKASAPIDCLPQEVLAADAPYDPFPDLSSRDDVLAAAREFNQGCLDMAGPELLASVSTFNTAQDMELIRQALGEEQISFLGFSYGTYLGATYATLFPNQVRAFVLDGAIDPIVYARYPVISGMEQAAGFETAFTRFFANCSVEACQFAGGKEGWRALVDTLDTTPLNTGIDPARPVTGSSVINASVIALYVRQWWPILDQALAAAAVGDAQLLQVLSDVAVGRNEDGTVAPGSGAFPAITAIDQDYPTDLRIQDYLFFAYSAISPSFGPSTFWASIAGGYSAFEWPVEANARFDGPFQYPAGGTPILVIGTTFDPATPYRGSVAMTSQLGNATLLSMNGDGHTAYGGNSACIDTTVDAYLLSLTAPPANTLCEQELAPPAGTDGGDGTDVDNPEESPPGDPGADSTGEMEEMTDAMVDDMTDDAEQSVSEAMANLGFFADAIN
jgi:pimeloyl-ACP methyl ester carboxylesterase